MTDRFEALSHTHRYAVLRLLVRRYPDRIPAGDIAAAMDIKPNTLSNHLAHLLRTDLVTQERQGTSLLYAANMPGLQQMMGEMFQECCRGRPDLCPPSLITARDETKPMTDRKYTVLFICTGNSARSIFAEAILTHEAGDRFEAYSAGTKPTSELNPIAVQMLEDKGIDVSRLTSKNVRTYQGAGAPEFDFVFTVCDQAANEDCPVWAGQGLSAHWGTKDPVKATGTDAEKMLAFQEAYSALRHRITAFTALPLETLDRLSLQTAIDDIAKLETP